MGRREMGLCRFCDGFYYLTGWGTLREHRRTIRVVGRVGAFHRIGRRCPGSGTTPRRS